MSLASSSFNQSAKNLNMIASAGNGSVPNMNLNNGGIPAGARKKKSLKFKDNKYDYFMKAFAT